MICAKAHGRRRDRRYGRHENATARAARSPRPHRVPCAAGIPPRRPSALCDRKGSRWRTARYPWPSAGRARRARSPWVALPAGDVRGVYWTMPLHPLAGAPAPASALIDVERLEREFMTRFLDPADPSQRVRFGTSGHRGTSLTGSSPRRTSWRSRRRSATTAVATARTGRSIWGWTRMRCRSRRRPVALEVLAANGVETDHSARRRLHADAGHISRDPRPQPRPQDQFADGIVITPSHNPPEDGGFKSNPLEWRPGGY